MNANLNAPSADAVDIDALDLSDQWKTWFKAVRKHGGLNAWNHIKTLPQEEKKAAFREMRPPIGSFLLAFFFGFFYYAAKGMWKKGLVMLAIVWSVIIALATVLSMIFGNAGGSGAVFVGHWIFAQMAIRDYYAFKVEKDDGWLPVKPF